MDDNIDRIKIATEIWREKEESEKSTEEIYIGEYKLSRDVNGQILIENDDGTDMTCTEADLRTAIHNFFMDNYDENSETN